MSYQPSSGVDVRLKIFPLAFLYLLCTPVLEIDGSPPIKGRWGVSRIPLAPGRHQVTAYCPYLFFKRMGESTTVIDVYPNQFVGVSWRAPGLVFLRGSWKATQAASTPAPVEAQPLRVQLTSTEPASPAGWHPDPMRRYQLRYWDGQTWTAHVSTNGSTGVDPLG